MEKDEEKKYEDNLSKLEEYQQECKTLRQNFEKSILSQSENKTDVDIQQSIKKLDSKMHLIIEMDKFVVDIDTLVGIPCINIDLQALKQDVQSPFGNNLPFFQIQQKDWKLAHCNRDGKISNNGKTFHTIDECCWTRVSDGMSPKSGVYKIQWRVDVLPRTDGYDGIGICTKDMNCWWDEPNHIGWCNTACNLTPYGLVGSNVQSENIFLKQAKMVNGSITHNVSTNNNSKRYSNRDLNLPRFKKNDIIGLIYDSDNHILQFEYNGKIWKSKLVNMPDNLTLYWCAGRWNSEIKLSIVKL